MENKKLLIFGTRHYRAGEIPKDVETAFTYILDNGNFDAVLEEAAPDEMKRVTAFKAICLDRKPALNWINIGTPVRPDLMTGGFYENHPKICFGGPVEAQVRREQIMHANIRESMKPLSCGLVVLGEGHLFSVSFRLMDEFEVEPYGYFA
jgi:hypothetical protein